MKKLLYIVLTTVLLCVMWSWREGAARGQSLSPPGPLWLEVDQGSQILRIMRGTTPIRITLISSGKPATPTPNGTFAIQNRGRFFSVGYASAKYYTSFKGWGRYMFHSILFDSKGKKILPAAAEQLGNKASHGCIRLPVHDALWIYKYVPAGTKVKIFAGVTPFSKKSIKLDVDGKKVSFSKKPRWFGGQLYVPARDLASWTGWQVSWQAKSMSVSLASGGNRLELPMSIPLMKTNGTPEPLKLPAFLIYQTTWVPLDPVVREMGYQTFWQGNTLVAAKAVPAISQKKPEPKLPTQDRTADSVYSRQATVPSTVYNPAKP